MPKKEKQHLETSFWKRPEGKVGMVFLGIILVGGLSALVSNWSVILPAISSGIGFILSLVVLAMVVFLAIDSKSRALFGYMYKSAMRWLTGLFIKIDPIGILKSYIEDLEDNLRKMNRQIGKLRGQMHKLGETIHNNKISIQQNLEQASHAKEKQIRDKMILKTRKAARLKESNGKLESLYNKMEVLYRVLTRMHENSFILKEDIKDQVMVKEQERKAIHASSSAMKSAMSIISGDPDKRAMFDSAMELVADDVANKVGEMEQFMEMSNDFMNSVDLKNGIFEEKGMKMLEEWENQADSLLLGDEKSSIIIEANNCNDILDLDKPIKKPIIENRSNQYDSFFE